MRRIGNRALARDSRSSRSSTRPSRSTRSGLETVPWPHTSPAESIRPVTSRRIRRLSFVLLLTGAVALVVALAALVPLLAGTDLSAAARERLLMLMFPSALGVGALAGLAIVQWRARRLAADTLRSSARELQRGAWRSAVNRMREEPPAEPSAFGDLANQVEGVMGESERRWQARVELSSEWYWETDERHRLSTLSAEAPMVKPADRALGDLLGRRHDELGFVHPPAGGWAAFNQMLERHESFREQEFEVDGLAGRARGWVALSGRARYHRDGRFSGYEGVGRDITAHKEAYRRLQASEQRYAVLAGLSADWYWATDAEHRFIDEDSELHRRFGALADAIVGRTRWEVYADALPEAQWRAHRADMEAGRPFQGLEFLVKRPDGTQMWVSVAGAPRHDDSGRFIGYHGVGPTGVAVNHLRAFLQGALCQLVILRAEGLREARNALDRFLPRLRAEEIGNRRVLLGQWGDSPTNRVQLDALLGYFGDVRVRLQLLQTGVGFLEQVNVEARDDGVNGQHQVLVTRLQRLEQFPGLHGTRPVAVDAADVVVHVAQAVQAEVDADLGGRAGGADALDALADALAEQAVGGNGDDLRPTFLVTGNDKLVQVRAQERLAPGEGHVERGAPQVMKDLPPLGDAHVVVGLAPDVAGATFGVALVADADDHAEGVQARPAKAAEGPVSWQFRNQTYHGYLNLWVDANRPQPREAAPRSRQHGSCSRPEQLPALVGSCRGQCYPIHPTQNGHAKRRGVD